MIIAPCCITRSCTVASSVVEKKKSAYRGHPSVISGKILVDGEIGVESS